MYSQTGEGAAALLVRRDGEAWNWAVLSEDGTTSAEGVAKDQDAAMSAAWATSRASAAKGAWDYPNIIVGRE